MSCGGAAEGWGEDSRDASSPNEAELAEADAIIDDLFGPSRGVVNEADEAELEAMMNDLLNDTPSRGVVEESDSEDSDSEDSDTYRVEEDKTTGRLLNAAVTGCADRLTDPDSTAANPRPFRLALSKSQPGKSSGRGFGESDVLASFTQFVEARHYIHIKNDPQAYGLDDRPDLVSDNQWLTHFLTRALLSARDGGGIAFNIAGYTKARVQVACQRYKTMLGDKQQLNPLAKFLTHDEFMSENWTDPERALLGYDDGRPHFPGYTDWELASIVCNPDLLVCTEIYDIPFIIDEQGREAVELRRREESAEALGKEYTPEMASQFGGPVPQARVVALTPAELKGEFDIPPDE